MIEFDGHQIDFANVEQVVISRFDHDDVVVVTPDAEITLEVTAKKHSGRKHHRASHGRPATTGKRHDRQSHTGRRETRELNHHLHAGIIDGLFSSDWLLNLRHVRSHRRGRGR